MALFIQSFKFEETHYHLFLYPQEDDRTEVIRVTHESRDVLITFTANCEIRIANTTIGCIQYHRGENNQEVLKYLFYNKLDEHFITPISVNNLDAYFKCEEIISLHLLKLAQEKNCIIPELIQYFN